MPLPDDFRTVPPGARAAREGLLATAELETNEAWGSVSLDRADDACCFPTVVHACQPAALEPAAALRSDGAKLLRGPDGYALVPGEGNFLKQLFRRCDHARGGGGECAAPGVFSEAARGVARA